MWVRAGKVTEEVSARMPTPDEAQTLGLVPRQPVLVSTRRVWGRSPLG